MASAIEATNYVNKMKKIYGAEISYSINNTTIHRGDIDVSEKEKKIVINCKVECMDTVKALSEHHDGKTAVLNFASYKNPGGGFIRGRMAQEEDLCYKSTLYPVISTYIQYYENNRNKLNNGLYTNAALYSEDIVFEINNSIIKADVITCAAPNWHAAMRNGISRLQNSRTLKSRIEFVLKVAALHDVDTLILGAWGCGVFKQDSTEVAELFQNTLQKYPYFKTVVFAIPGDKNFDAFKYTFG